MGLDMYLEAERYIGGWKHSSEWERNRYEKILALTGCKPWACKESAWLTVSLTVAYWRKANAIHRWFVDHCQDGHDECQRTEIEANKLRELVGLCKQVLASVETCEGLVSVGRTYHPDGTVVHNTRPGQIIAQQGIAHRLLPTQGGPFFGETDYDENYLVDLHDTIRQLEPLLDNELYKDFTFYYRASW